MVEIETPDDVASDLETGEEVDQDTLVARAQDGDLAAFESLVDNYSGQVFRLALRMVADREEAEDIVQEALIAVWRRLPVLHNPGAFGGWVYRIVTNRCLDLLKQRAARRTEAVAGDELDLPDQAAAAPDRAAEWTAQASDLERLLLTVLSPNQRACWLLREVHGRTYAEIAETLDISEGAVRGQIARARTQLAKGMIAWR